MCYHSQVYITVLILEVIHVELDILVEKKGKRSEVVGGREIVLVHSPLVGSFVTKGTRISGCLGAGSLFMSPLCLLQLQLFVVT